MHTLLYNVALLAAQFKLWHNVNTAEMMGVHSWGLVPNRLATELLGELVCRSDKGGLCMTTNIFLAILQVPGLP